MVGADLTEMAQALDGPNRTKETQQECLQQVEKQV